MMSPTVRMIKEAYMTEEATAEERTAQDRRQRTPPSSGEGVVYVIGFIGALVWFWQQADGAGEHAVAVVKAFVWPALLVYEAFKALHRLSLNAQP